MTATCYNHRDRKEPVRLCNVCQRIGVEHEIAEKALKAAFAAGYAVSVVNGDDDETKHYRYDAHIGLQPSVNNVLAVMFQTDEDYLYLWPANDPQEHCFGWIRFIYGNDGYDVISDYSVSLEDILKSVNAYADTLA